MQKATTVESQILARELGRLGGIGARWVARFLPTVDHNSAFVVNESTTVVGHRVEEFLKEFGRPLPEFPCEPEKGRYSAIVGSGHLNLNPTMVYVQVNETAGMASVSIRAVAKEGKVKQLAAQRLIERIERLLVGQRT